MFFKHHLLKPVLIIIAGVIVVLIIYNGVSLANQKAEDLQANKEPVSKINAIDAKEPVVEINPENEDKIIYEQGVDDEGAHFKSEAEIEGTDSKNVETNININDGQVISNSSIRATGTSIIIKESQTIFATSSQVIKYKNNSNK